MWIMCTWQRFQWATETELNILSHIDCLVLHQSSERTTESGLRQGLDCLEHLLFRIIVAKSSLRWGGLVTKQRIGNITACRPRAR